MICAHGIASPQDRADLFHVEMCLIEIAEVVLRASLIVAMQQADLDDSGPTQQRRAQFAIWRGTAQLARRLARRADVDDEPHEGDHCDRGHEIDADARATTAELPHGMASCIFLWYRLL